jgi:hypothetical protein
MVDGQRVVIIDGDTVASDRSGCGSRISTLPRVSDLGANAS